MADGDDKLEIQGAGGGKGGGGRKPVEAPDTLHSIASAQVVDLVSEGPIVGFATENPLESVYLDETPMANPDGSLNFKDVQLEYRYGTQDQEYIKGFPFVENEIMAGVQLRHDVPFTRSITNNELSAIRVRIAVQGLSKVDEETNDLIGHSIQYAIDLAVGLGGTYKNVLTTAITGKTTSTYARSHRIDLPPSTSGWMLRVRRLTPNADSATTQDTTVIEATTEIIDAKLRYPNSALVATKVNAEQFPTIPRRAFDLVGRIVRVPSNYDPIARTYDGIWDGTFKPEWTDNPAWIYYDAVLHDRYGLGHRIKSHQIDQWALYRIARICDELVPDGKGGLEPRYTCNVFIQEQVEAYRLLRDLASVFNGIAYYADNRIIAGIDAPADPAVEYTNSDVIDGRFTYSGSGKSTRATVALVTWYDPDDFYRPKIEPVVDDAGVARYGIEQIELIATGCTSQGQAQRAGWWALLTGRLETEGVTFSLGLKGTFAMPGQVIRIADQHRAGRRIGGRISDATQNSVTVDKLPEVVPTVGDRVSAMLPNGLVEKRQIVSVEGRKLTTVAFSSVPVKGGAWIIETDTLHPTTWRVVSVTEASGSGDGSDGMTFNISAVEHAPEKFDAIDGGVLIEGPPTTQLPSTVQPAPAYVSLSAVERAGHVVASPMLAIEWPQTTGAVRYGVTYRREDGDWNELPATTATRVEIDNVFKGTYIAQVWAYNAAGVTSGRTTSEPFVLGDQTMLPGVISDHEDRITSTKDIVDEMQLDFADMDQRIEQVKEDAEDAADELNQRADQLRIDVDAAQAAADALAAEIGEIVNAPEWDTGEDYIAGWLVREDGGLYRAKIANTNVRPSTNPGTWEYLGQYASVAEVASAALQQATTTANELQAEAERINALVARMPDGTDKLVNVAQLTQVQNTLADATAAVASDLSLLGAKTANGQGWILDQSTVRVSSGETLGQRLSSIQSDFDDANARIDAEETARADGDAALATTLATVQATANNAATKAELTSAQNALAAADAALAQRTEAMEVRMPTGTGGLATAQSVTQATNRVSTVEGTVSAHSGQLATHTAEIAGKANSSTVTALSNTVTQQGTTLTAHGQQLSGLSVSVGDAEASINELREVSVAAAAGSGLANGDFEAGSAHWNFVNASLSETFPRSGRYHFRFNGGASAGTAESLVPFKVEPNTEVRLSFWARQTPTAPNGNVRLAIRWLDSNGGQIAYATTNASLAPGTATSYRQVTGAAVPPTGAVYARIVIQALNTAGGWCVDDVAVTVPSPTLAEMLAKYSLAVTAGGDVAGMQLLAGGGTSAIRFLADMFSIVDPGGTGGYTHSAGVSVWRIGGAMIAIGPGFGAGSEFVFWAGPNQSSLNNCTRANAGMYFTRTNDAYFGGSLSSGAFKNGGTSSQISNYASVETERFGTNGRPKNVVSSLSYSNSGVVSAAQLPTAGPITATVVVQRSRNGDGVWTTIGTYTATGNVVVMPPIGGEYSVDISMGGSITVTDNSTGLQDFEYRAQITGSTGNWPWYNPNATTRAGGTQTLTILSTENPS